MQESKKPFVFLPETPTRTHLYARSQTAFDFETLSALPVYTETTFLGENAPNRRIATPLGLRRMGCSLAVAGSGNASRT